MAGRIRYTQEFKLGAVAQVTDKGHSVASVAGRLGVSTKSLYDWIKLYGGTPSQRSGSVEVIEIKRLKAELRRVTEERDILKKATAYFARDPVRFSGDEVRLYEGAPRRVFRARYVPCFAGSS